MWRTFALINDGYWTTATCLVTWANNLTVRDITSSKSVAPSKKFSIALRSAEDKGFTLAN